MSAKSARLAGLSGRQKERFDQRSIEEQPPGLKGFRPGRGGDSLEGFASDWWMPELMRTPAGELLIFGLVSAMLLTACGAGQTIESTPGAVGVTEILAAPVEVPPTAMWTATALSTLLSPEAAVTQEPVFTLAAAACDAMVSEKVLNSLPSASPVENPQEFEAELNAFLASQGINQPARIGETLAQVQAKISSSWQARVMARSGAGWFVETLDENGEPRWAAENGRFHDRPDAIWPVDAGQQVDMKELPKPTGKWAAGAPVAIIRPECSPAVTYVWVSKGRARLVFDSFTGQWRKFQATPEPPAAAETVSPAEVAETEMSGAGGALPEFVGAGFRDRSDQGDENLTPMPPPEMGAIWTENWGAEFPPEYTATGSYINQEGEKMLVVKFQMSKSVLDGTGIESIYVDPKMLTEAVVLFWGQFAASLQIPLEGDPEYYAEIYPEFAGTDFYDINEPNQSWVDDLINKVHLRLESGKKFQFDGRFGMRIVSNEPRQPICDLNAVRLVQVSPVELEKVRQNAGTLSGKGIIFRDIDRVAVNTPDIKGVVLFDCNRGVLTIAMFAENVIDVSRRMGFSVGPEDALASIADFTPEESSRFGAAKLVHTLRQILELASRGVNFFDETPFFSLFGCGYHSEGCEGTEIRDPQSPDRVLVRVEVK